MMGDFIHHPFDPKHPLGAAKPAKGGGALGVGFQPVRGDPDMVQQVGIIRMQHGAVGHGQGEILRPAAAGVMCEI